jgi:hypothetical protein
MLVLFESGAVTVPPTCLNLLLAGRDALELYARVHADTNDPVVEALLIKLTRLPSRNTGR